MEENNKTKKVTEILEEVKQDVFANVDEETRDSIINRFIYLLLTK